MTCLKRESIYNSKVLSVCLSVTFLLIPSRWVFHGSRLVFMVFNGSRLVFHGSRLVFHGSRLASHGFSLFLVGFYGSRLTFMVIGQFSWFSWFHVDF